MPLTYTVFPCLGARRVEGANQVNSIKETRYQALDTIQELLTLVEDVPATQTRLLLQAGLLDLVSCIEELSKTDQERLFESNSTVGSTGEVA